MEARHPILDYYNAKLDEVHAEHWRFVMSHQIEGGIKDRSWYNKQYEAEYKASYYIKKAKRIDMYGSHDFHYTSICRLRKLVVARTISEDKRPQSKKPGEKWFDIYEVDGIKVFWYFED